MSYLMEISAGLMVIVLLILVLYSMEAREDNLSLIPYDFVHQTDSRTCKFYNTVDEEGNLISTLMLCDNGCYNIHDHTTGLSRSNDNTYCPAGQSAVLN